MRLAGMNSGIGEEPIKVGLLQTFGPPGQPSDKPDKEGVKDMKFKYYMVFTMGKNGNAEIGARFITSDIKLNTEKALSETMQSMCKEQECDTCVMTFMMELAE